MKDPVVAGVRKRRNSLQQEAGGSVRGLFELMRKSQGARKKSVLREESINYKRRD